MTFDIILASDVLFFESFHNDLIDSIGYFLEQNPAALFITVNKIRGKSIDNFLERLDQRKPTLCVKAHVAADEQQPQFRLIIIQRRPQS